MARNQEKANVRRVSHALSPFFFSALFVFRLLLPSDDFSRDAEDFMFYELETICFVYVFV